MSTYRIVPAFAPSDIVTFRASSDEIAWSILAQDWAPGTATLERYITDAITSRVMA